MKTFKTEHLFFNREVSPAQEFTEDKPLSMFTHKDFQWFWRDHILTLEISESVKTDFQKITRLS